MTLGRLLAGAAALALTAGVAQADISGGKVVIGVLNDQSGLYTDIGGPGSVEAAKMAVEDFGGKVDGKPIEVLSADHQNKPDVGSNIVRKWIDQDGVDMVIDVPNSGVALAVQQVTREKGAVFIQEGPATTELTNDQCSKTGIHYAYDTSALARGTGAAMIKKGGDTWFFITADYAFGHNLQDTTAQVVKEHGGKVLGSVNAPLSTSDFSSYLLQAQGSGAKVIGLANAGGDTVNSVKQAHEFGITQGGQKLAALLVFLTDVHAIGLDTAQGLTLTTGWYWDLNDQTRAFADRFAKRMNGKRPTMEQAGTYSAVMQYLNAIKAIGSDKGVDVVDQMKKTPINDMFTHDGHIRPDGLMVHDMYLAQVKAPSESKKPWDYYKILETIPGDQAFAPLSESTCPYLKKSQ